MQNYYIDGKTIGEGIKKIPSYKCTIPFDKLNKLRDSFWKSKKRYKVLWDVLKECCETDSDTAEILLEAATMECLEGNLRKVYFLSNPEFIFHVPNFCICDPVFEREYEGIKNKYKKIDEKNIVIYLYYVSRNKNVKIETTNKTSVKEIKVAFSKNINIKYDEYKIRLFFKGLELLDDNLLCYNNVDNMSKIHAMVNPK